MILNQLADYARQRVAEDAKTVSLEAITAQALALPKGDFAFEKALRNKPAIICEVKKASPSKGIIAADFPYVDIAQEYETSGADAISVLTEPKWFLGSDAIFRDIRQRVSLPMLRKDFTVDAYQIYQAKVMGADAVLLICAILDAQTIAKWLHLCDGLGMSVLVEAHDAVEVKMALAAGARVIGVNNRNLKDFTINPENAASLRGLVPDEAVFVAESGIQGTEDALQALSHGADALLIGEALLRAQDRAAFIRTIKEEGARGKN